MRSVDLNCDLGESVESIRDGTDAALMEHVSSANVACGGHAGDDATMEASVREAIRRGVAVGAHPSYPDRPRFGRFEMAMTDAEIEAQVGAQVRALHVIARRLGADLVHVKPHGALYHAASRSAGVAAAIARGAAAVSRDLVLVGAAGSPALAVWESMGFGTAAEGFADRLYEADGSLRTRAHADALVSDPPKVAEQAARLARGTGAVARDGTIVALAVRTICVHGDTPGAVAVVRAVRKRLDEEGFRIERLGRTGSR